MKNHIFYKLAYNEPTSLQGGVQFPTGGNFSRIMISADSAHERVVSTLHADLVQSQSRRYSPDERRRRHQHPSYCLKHSKMVLLRAYFHMS